MSGPPLSVYYVTAGDEVTFLGRLLISDNVIIYATEGVRYLKNKSVCQARRWLKKKGYYITPQSSHNNSVPNFCEKEESE